MEGDSSIGGSSENHSFNPTLFLDALRGITAKMAALCLLALKELTPVVLEAAREMMAPIAMGVILAYLVEAAQRATITKTMTTTPGVTKMPSAEQSEFHEFKAEVAARTIDMDGKKVRS